MVNFDILRYKNLLSTGNTWTEINLSASPMTLIVGKNGSGKSTMIDALCYVLFGRPYRKINLGDLINSINGRELLVEVEFRIGIRKYLVRRGQKPSIFEIYQDGKEMSQDASSKDYQKVLENILGFNQKTFTQICVVGSNLYVPFMRLEAKDRRVIVENILDAEIFSIMKKISKQKHDALVEELESVKDAIQTLEGKIELHSVHMEQAKIGLQDQILEKQTQLSDLDREQCQLTTSINSIQLKINILQDTISDLPKVEYKLQTAEKLAVEIRQNLNRELRQKLFYQNNSNCPTCQQGITNRETMIHDCETKAGEFETGLNDLQQKITQITDRMNIIRQVQTRIQEMQRDLTAKQTKSAQIIKFMKGVLAEISKLESTKPSTDLAKIEMDLKDQLDVLVKRRNTLLEEEIYSQLSEVILKDSGIKANVIKEYLPAINSTVNKYLADLDFFVNFHLDENFNETIKSRHRDQFKYENFSEGQKRRIDLSLIFTWRMIAKIKNSTNTNLLILDEVLDGSLDSDGMDEFMNLLNTFGNTTNVFLISHRGDVLADKFNHILRFDMVGTFSELA